MPEPYCYEYPRPAVTVDVVAFTLREEALHVLLIRRKKDPFAGRWAIPGGFLEIDEPVAQGALRELREETGLEAARPLAPIGFFGDVDRDPRGRTISLAFATLFRSPGLDPRAADDAEEAAWRPVAGLEALAFDHDRILETALTWLKSSIEAGPGALDLLPEPFSRSHVESLFRSALGRGDAAEGWFSRLRRSGAILPSGARGSYRAHRSDDPGSTGPRAS